MPKELENSDSDGVPDDSDESVESQSTESGGTGDEKRVNGLSSGKRALSSPSRSPSSGSSAAKADLASASNSDDEEIQPKARKKRRIINDDDESDDSPTPNSRLGKSKQKIPLENHDSSDQEEASITTPPSLSTRLKSSSAKNRPSIHDEEDPPTSSGTRQAPRQTSSTVAKEQQDTKAANIPKKKVPRKTEADAPPKSSLLAHMDAPPKSSLLAQMDAPPLPTAASRPAPSKPPSSRTGTNQAKPKQPPAAQPARISQAGDTITQRRDNFPQPPLPRTPPRPPPAAPATANIKWSEEVVMKDLQEVCRRCSEDPNFQLTQTGKVDFNGSFLPKMQERYEFFDTNERGEIVLQPKPPIFPEEFPKGMKEHDLGWWGILDPALGDGKYRAEPPTVVAEPMMPPPYAAPLHQGQGGPAGMKMQRQQQQGRRNQPPDAQPPHHGYPGRGNTDWGRGSGPPPPPGWDGPRGGDGRRPYDGPPSRNSPPPNWNARPPMPPPPPGRSDGPYRNRR